MAEPLPFILLTAFANNSSSGNPAAVVFLKQDLPTDSLQTISRILNQPITAFLSSPLPSKDDETAKFGIRWFSTLIEIPLCGHGTLAAAKAVFAAEGLVPEKVEMIEFQTASRAIITARRVNGGWIEIQLPSAMVQEVTSEERNKLQPMLERAFGKDNIAVNFMGKGGKGFEHYLMVELDEIENLAASTVDVNALRNTGYFVNIFTTISPNENVVFVSRMFSPLGLSGGEDHVCGSAHCLLAPHWSTKLGLVTGREIQARQVSARGGVLGLIWEKEKSILRLRGEVTIIGKGELTL